MNYTEKNCTVVDEEDKERGYNWGLDIKASPRKGYHKHNEEVEVLKVRKNLFVAKPKGGGDTYKGQEVQESDEANISRTVEDDGRGVTLQEIPQLTHISGTEGNPSIIDAGNGQGFSSGIVVFEENRFDDVAGQNVNLGVGMTYMLMMLTILMIMSRCLCWLVI
ncbi:unnamed protein product [Amaranthus hypochondriacus]